MLPNIGFVFNQTLLKTLVNFPEKLTQTS